MSAPSPAPERASFEECVELDRQHGRHHSNHRSWHRDTLKLCASTPSVRNFEPSGGCAACTAAPLCEVKL